MAKNGFHGGRSRHHFIILSLYKIIANFDNSVFKFSGTRIPSIGVFRRTNTKDSSRANASVQFNITALWNGFVLCDSYACRGQRNHFQADRNINRIDKSFCATACIKQSRIWNVMNHSHIPLTLNVAVTEAVAITETLLFSPHLASKSSTPLRLFNRLVDPFLMLCIPSSL